MSESGDIGDVGGYLVGVVVVVVVADVVAVAQSNGSHRVVVVGKGARSVDHTQSSRVDAGILWLVGPTC